MAVRHPAVTALDDDAQRLLLAGAPMAHGDGPLAEHAAAVETLARSVPSLEPLARQARRVLDAAPSACASELLTLAALAARVVRAQAHADAAEGDLCAPAAAASRDDFGCPDDVRIAAYEALTCEGHGRAERLQALLAHELRHDVRLLPAWIAATDHPPVASQAAALLGAMKPELVRAPLEAAFDPSGGPGDAIRLDALVRLMGRDEARALTVDAATNGSPHVAGRALELLRGLDPAAAERLATSLLSRPMVYSVGRYALITSLSHASTPAAIAALVALLGDADRGVFYSALRTLELLPVARVEPEIRALLATLLARLAAPFSDDQRAARVALAWLAERPTVLRAADEPLLAGFFHGSTDEAIRASAGLAMKHVGTDHALSQVALEVGSPAIPVAQVAIDAAIALGEDQAFVRLAPLCSPHAIATPAGLARAALVVGRLAAAHEPTDPPAAPRTLDPRWLQPCVALVARLDAGVEGRAAVRALIRARCSAAWQARDAQTLPSLDALMALADEARWYALPVLARLGGAPAIERIVAATGLTGTALRAKCATMLRELPYDKAWFELRCVAVDRNCDRAFSPADRAAIVAMCVAPGA